MGYEVDVIAGDLDLAVEVKGAARVHDGDVRGVRALAEEHRVRRRVVACLEKQPRRLADGSRTSSFLKDPKLTYKKLAVFVPLQHTESSVLYKFILSYNADESDTLAKFTNRTHRYCSRR